MADASRETRTHLLLTTKETYALQQLLGEYVRARTTRDDNPDVVTLDKKHPVNWELIRDIAQALARAPEDPEDYDSDQFSGY
jgi:hypothetical protein